MKRTFVKDIKCKENKEVLIEGWIYKIRDLSHICFLLLRDKSGIVQIVCNKMQISELRQETAIKVIGNCVKNEKSPNGIEINARVIEICGKTYYDKMPFDIHGYKQNANLETMLDYRTIALRIPKKKAIFKVQNEIEESFRKFFKSRDFEEIHTPKIINSGTEGGSEMFTVNYFNKRAFLAQSPQFYKQMMVGAGFERVFEIGYAYRAELHNTYRHLNEYVSMDIEMGFINDEKDIMNIEEEFLKYMFGHLSKSCKNELDLYKASIPEDLSIPRIPISEAQKILRDKYNKKSPVGNLDNEGEVLFSQYIKDQYDSDFVFLTEYPTVKRPMYAMEDEDDHSITKSFDLIYKGLEITTGGQRIHDYEMLKEKMNKLHLDLSAFEFYLNTFKYGMIPHGGFAIGLERITMQVLGLSNIREAALFPRDIKRLEP